LNFKKIFDFVRFSPVYASHLKHTATSVTTLRMETPTVVVVPLLSDNYGYLIVDKANKIAAVVDPAEPDPIINSAKSHNLTITSVLTTHHHWDHAGGNEKLVEKLGQGIQVYGADQRIPKLTHMLKHNENFTIGNLKIRALFTPCHTSGHVLYYVEPLQETESPLLFTGDTLFIGGCGRFFEGTPQQMYDALFNVVGKLPHQTKIYCGHEYTIKNLQFALTVEPNNQHIKSKLDWAIEQRRKGVPTVPSTIAEELKYNPFMRVDQLDVAQSVGGGSPVQVMEKVRKRKDFF